MTGPHWAALLEEAADRTAVGPPPMQALRVGAARRQRHRCAAKVACLSAAVVLVIGGPLLLANSEVAPQDPRPAAVSTGPDGADTAPAGTRLVGLGRIAIAVPQQWGTNQTKCGVARQDTVIINVGGIDACYASPSAGVDSVELGQGKPRFDFAADDTLEIDGEQAQRQRTTCTKATRDRVQVCAGTVYFPAQATWFRAESTTSRDDVDRTLSGIRIELDRIGVPTYQPLTLNAQGRSGDIYAARLAEAGFDVDIRTRKIPAGTPGYVLDATPTPGTMLPPGSTVAITVIAEPDDPADQVSVGIGTDSKTPTEQFVSDPQIRAGDTLLRLNVGERIWAYAHGRRAYTLAGHLRGDALAIDIWQDGPNYPHSWIATASGRTTITLNIEANGQAVELGKVTVLVN